MRLSPAVAEVTAAVRGRLDHRAGTADLRVQVPPAAFTIAALALTGVVHGDLADDGDEAGLLGTARSWWHRLQRNRVLVTGGATPVRKALAAAAAAHHETGQPVGLHHAVQQLLHEHGAPVVLAEAVDLLTTRVVLAGKTTGTPAGQVLDRAAGHGQELLDGHVVVGDVLRALLLRDLPAASSGVTLMLRSTAADVLIRAVVEPFTVVVAGQTGEVPTGLVAGAPLARLLFERHAAGGDITAGVEQLVGYSGEHTAVLAAIGCVADTLAAGAAASGRRLPQVLDTIAGTLTPGAVRRT
jgi:hypothetical protein